MNKAVSGSFYLSLAQCIFAISGYLVNIGLARVLGPEVYGQYGVTISVLVWLEILLSTGLSTATTKMVAEKSESAGSIAWLFLRYMGICSLILFIVVMGLGGFMAKWLSDEQLEIYIRIAAIDLLFYGYLKILMAVHNGVRKYAGTSVIIIVYAISKAVFILGLAGFGFSIEGALVGNFIATLMGLIAGFFLVIRLDDAPLETKEVMPALKLTFPSTIWAVCIILLMSTDLWVAKAIIGGQQIGYYVAAAALARIVYLLSTGIRIIVLPEISKLIACGNYGKAKESLIRMTIGFLPVLLGLTVFLNVFSERIISIVYSVSYKPAAPLLSIMVVGYFALTYCEFFSRALTAIGKVWHSAGIFLFISLCSIPINIFLIKKFGILGAAYGLVILSCIGALTSGIFVFHALRSR